MSYYEENDDELEVDYEGEPDEEDEDEGEFDAGFDPQEEDGE